MITIKNIVIPYERKPDVNSKSCIVSCPVHLGEGRCCRRKSSEKDEEYIYIYCIHCLLCIEESLSV